MNNAVIKNFKSNDYMFTNLEKHLQNHFGFDHFRPGQEAAITSVLKKKNTLVVMPTGAGKSLCYQLPGVLQSGTTVVVSPLIALMKDQVEALANINKSATFINSSISTAEQNRRLEDLRNGHIKLLYVAPERFRNVSFLEIIERVELSHFVVDEAHCISQWGHDFRPDYLTLKDIIARLKYPPVAALTATATVQVQNDIIQQLGLQNCERIVTGFNRPNLSFEVEYTPDDNAKLSLLDEHLAVKKGSAIIYTGTRRDAEEVAEYVQRCCRRKAAFYHGGMSSADRDRTQNLFMSGEIPIIVATNAFGMGVDKPDIRCVIHYSLPGTLEAYYQEAGRAGRDADPARCLLYYAPQDRSLQEFFIENSFPTRDEMEEIYTVIKNNESDGFAAIARGYIERKLDLYETKVRVGIAELVKAGALIHLGDRGGMINLKLPPKLRLDLSDNLRRISKQKGHRTKQLSQIIRYAEDNHCRRQFILTHFGDSSKLTAERCCDFCLSGLDRATATKAPGEFNESEKAALIILHTLQHLKREAGRTKIAEILTGSRAKALLKFGWHRVKNYGRLQHYSQPFCLAYIDELLKRRYLKLVGGIYPILQLTPKGTDALKNLEPIGLDLPAFETQRVTGSRLNRKNGPALTIETTLDLFREGLSPEEITGRRNLTLRTVYKHLATLIENDSIQVTAVIPVERVQNIRNAIATAGLQSLKSIKEVLPQEFKYEEIACVVADEKRGQLSQKNELVKKHSSANHQSPLTNN